MRRGELASMAAGAGPGYAVGALGAFDRVLQSA